MKVPEIVDILKREVERTQAFAQAAELLTELGQIDQAIAENKAALANVRNDHEKAKADLAETADEIKRTIAAIDARENASRDSIKVAEGQAKESAEHVVRRAKEQAQELIDAALAQTAKAELEAKGRLEAIEQSAVDMKNQAKAAEITRDGMLEEARQVEARIAAMKEAASKVLA